MTTLVSLISFTGRASGNNKGRRREWREGRLKKRKEQLTFFGGFSRQYLYLINDITFECTVETNLNYFK